MQERSVIFLYLISLDNPQRTMKTYSQKQYSCNNWSQKRKKLQFCSAYAKGSIGKFSKKICGKFILKITILITDWFDHLFDHAIAAVNYKKVKV